jgi:signal peptidase I
MISRRIHRCLFDVPRSAVAKKRHVIPRFRSYGTQQSRNTGIKPDNTSTSSEPSMVLVLVPRILMAGGILYCAFEYVADITMCEGPSMTPTIQPYGEILLIDKWNLKIECNAEKRVQLALQKQRETSNEFWHEPHISVTDVPPYTWLQKWHHVRSSLNVGDVVVVDHPCRKARVCKRLLGLPGDVVLVNHTGKLVTIPDGHVWLEGDCPVA